MNKPNGHQDPNVTSLDEARKRAAGKAKAEQRAASGRGLNTMRDWVIGGIIVLMAIGYIASLVGRVQFGGNAVPAATSKTDAAQ